jgi:hypothetical protein
MNINYDINLNTEDFKDTINFLLSSYKVDEIIETGTFNGLGSTKIFADTNKQVISIESCLSHHEQAKENLKNYKNVSLLYGSSLNLKEMSSFILTDEIYNSNLVLTGQIKTEGNVQNTASCKDFYLSEINGFASTPPEREDLLWPLINNDKNQLVFLDSAGGVGYLEYQKFMLLPTSTKQKKILLLDDISHVKHYRSVVHLIQNKHNVIISKDQRFAYCVFE